MSWEMVVGLMDEFVSTYTNRLDAKGRVSIPAPFRLVLARDGSDGLYCCPTLDRMAVDAGGKLLRDTIRQSLGQFEPFSEEHEQLSTTLLGESEILKIDQDGRAVLSDAIREHAGVTDLVTFVGVPLLLGGVAMVASVAPARRAIRMNPVEAIRTE